MELMGIVQNGVIVLADPTPLPEGATVRVVIEPTSLRQRLLKLAGTVTDLPSDMAINHDHYIHGAPKRTAGADDA